MRIRSATLAAAALGALAMVAACNYGPRVQNFGPATQPRGAHVAILLIGGQSDLVAEMYAVDDSGVVFHDGIRLARVRWDRIDAMDVEVFGRGYDLRYGRNISKEHVARLATISRFPQGLSPEVLKKLLERFRQDSIAVIASSPLDSLAHASAVAASRYADRRLAIADGYRRIGADFPSMGEHWLRVDAIYVNEVDASRPTILTYATIDGAPRLLGLGFLKTTAGRSEVGPDVPGWPEHWHEHSGFIADESSAHGLKPQTPSEGTRVWVLHVWSELGNPSGKYVADNWALPFTRAGLAAPARIDPSVAQALSLSVGGDVFLRGALTDVGLRTSHNSAVVDSLLARHAGRVAEVAARAREQKTLSVADAAALRDAWEHLGASMVDVAGPRAAPFFQAHPHVHDARRGITNAAP